MKYSFYTECIAFSEKAASFVVEVYEGENYIGKVSVLLTIKGKFSCDKKLTVQACDIRIDEIVKYCQSKAYQTIWTIE